MKKQVFIWEVIGTLFIITLGTLLHFTYEWFGRWYPIALISAVNESTWEHLKLAFWPAFLYAIVQFIFLKKPRCTILVAKAAGFYIMPIAIVVLFYSYTAILGSNYLVLDILVFIIAVILGQFASYRILILNKVSRVTCLTSILAIIMIVMMFSLFTFYPPRIFLFTDPVIGLIPTVCF